MEPLTVSVSRGGVVEAVHRVHAVAVRDGEVVASAGDPDLVAYLRSAAKPIQALPLHEAFDDLTDAELAIASASHRAQRAQIEAVRTLLARAGATESDLENGEQDCRPPGRIHHNCSGKHAGMLAACRANGWPLEGYRLPDHPLQRRIAGELEGVLATAIDGCGVPTFAMTLRERGGPAPPDRAADRGGHARAAGARRRRRLARHRADARAAGLDREGRGGGALLRRGAGRHRRRAQGRRRQLARAAACRRRVPRRPRLRAAPHLARVAVTNSRGEEVGEIS